MWRFLNFGHINLVRKDVKKYKCSQKFTQLAFLTARGALKCDIFIGIQFNYKNIGDFWWIPLFSKLFQGGKI